MEGEQCITTPASKRGAVGANTTLAPCCLRNLTRQTIDSLCSPGWLLRAAQTVPLPASPPLAMPFPAGAGTPHHAQAPGTRATHGAGRTTSGLLQQRAPYRGMPQQSPCPPDSTVLLSPKPHTLLRRATLQAPRSLFRCALTSPVMPFVKRCRRPKLGSLGFPLPQLSPLPLLPLSPQAPQARVSGGDVSHGGWGHGRIRAAARHTHGLQRAGG